MSEQIKEQVIEEEEVKTITRFDIPGMPKENPLHQIDATQRIIQHYTHAYDEHGNVIVVKGEKEDLEKSIGQYQSQVGPKNVIKMLEAGADPSILSTNSARMMTGNFTNMDFHGVNEAREAVVESNKASAEALAQFNKTYGTNLDSKTFLDLVEKGLLEAHIEGLKTSKKEESGGE